MMEDQDSDIVTESSVREQTVRGTADIFCF